MEGLQELSEMSARPLIAVVAAVARRPSLWSTAFRQMHRIARRGWWRRPPFLPVPDRRYLHFRMVTMYGGDGSSDLRAADAISYLEWCRDWPAVTR